jgi:hypothetical protein
VLAAVKAIEVRSAIDAQQHGLAINDEGSVSISKRGFGDQRNRRSNHDRYP